MLQYAKHALKYHFDGLCFALGARQFHRVASCYDTYVRKRFADIVDFGVSLAIKVYQAEVFWDMENDFATVVQFSLGFVRCVVGAVVMVCKSSNYKFASENYNGFQISI